MTAHRIVLPHVAIPDGSPLAASSGFPRLDRVLARQRRLARSVAGASAVFAAALTVLFASVF